jgi:uncharacterized protein DUF6529
MATVVEAPSGRVALAGVLLTGCAVAVALGVYGRGHGHSRPVFVVGFSGVIQEKVWLATAALLLVLIQVTTALWMWGRLPALGSAPGWVGPVHRWSGTIAFVLLIPVALNCLLTFGFESASTRVVLHSVAGCTFYGAYTAKMLGLRVRGLPGWTLPVLGGVVFTSLIVLWLTSALWFFGLNQPLT